MLPLKGSYRIWAASNPFEDFKLSEITGKTVLCVDDEADILELFKDELEDFGLNVLQANNGVEGLKVFKDNEIDCVLSDIRMPGGDGVGLVKNIKEIDQKVPIFLITGFSDYSQEELDGLGVNAIIFKPFDLDEVVKMVKGSLAS